MSRSCLQCHEPISDKRLAAVPNAVYCLGCKESQGDITCRVPAVNMARLGFTRAVTNDSYQVVRPRRLRLMTSGLGAA